MLEGYKAARKRKSGGRPTCVDLFAGAGGFSCGVQESGFDVVAADPKKAGYGSLLWSFRSSFTDPNKAVEDQVAVARKVVNRVNKALIAAEGIVASEDEG